MAVSFVFIGILIVLDILFLVNYLAVKSIRAWTDQQVETADHDRRSSATSMMTSVEQRPSSTSTTAAAASPTHCTTWLRKMYKRCSQPSAPSKATLYMKAIAMDIVHRDPSSVQKFYKWRDLPYACGKWSTVALVSLSMLLLSVEFAHHDTIAGALQASSRDLCSTTDFDGKINSFESEMNSVANMDLARKQFNWTEGFYEALVADTNLYGTYGYYCESVNGISGSKYSSNWTNSDEAFFPGYCSARMQAEIALAKSATCTHRQCECFKLFRRIRMCWIAKVCLEVGDSCPEYTKDMESELNGYETASEEIYVEEAQNQASTNQTLLSNISETISTAAVKTIGKILHQVNVASTAYVIYTLVGLFFPSPLLMFRLPYSYYIKDFLFGLHKPTFILFVVALWWGIEYFKPFWMNPDIQLYLKMLRIGDPCLFDVDFIDAKVSVLKDICDELTAMQTQFTTSTLAINRLSNGVGFFANSCNCSFPNKNLIEFQTPEYIFVSEAQQLGFVNEMDGLCEPPYCNRIFLPPKHNPFLGETSMCSDTNVARQYLLTATGNDATTNWWQLLLSTGFLSKLLISVVVTNLCISLYHLADPLSSCGGRYEWPPRYLFRESDADDQTGSQMTAARPVSSGGMSSTMAANLRERKTTSLRVISFKWAIIWGLLAHLCLVNLALAPIEDQSLGTADIIMAAIYLTIAATSVVLLICLRHRLRRHQVDDDIKSIDCGKRCYATLESDHQKQRSSPLLLTATSSESSNDDSALNFEVNLKNGHAHHVEIIERS